MAGMTQQAIDDASRDARAEYRERMYASGEWAPPVPSYGTQPGWLGGGAARRKLTGSEPPDMQDVQDIPEVPDAGGSDGTNGTNGTNGTSSETNWILPLLGSGLLALLFSR